METKAMNRKLTQVGPGTPMGKLLRYYWWPIAGSAELAENPVKAVTILGEHLTLFRDRQGRLGLVGQRCAHRRFDLQHGIPEANGLRCPYHGRTDDTTGQCVDQPAEPADSSFKDRVRIQSYPVEELGGLIFAYLGPQPAPLLPRWDLYTMDNAYRAIGEGTIPCNWLQCVENSADPVHTEYLHGHLTRYVYERQGKALPARTAGFDHHLKIDVQRHPLGLLKRRLTENASEEGTEWKYGHLLLFPDKVRLGNYGPGASVQHSMQIRVPMDDEHTWHLNYNVVEGPPGVSLPRQEIVPMVHSPISTSQGRPDLSYTLGQDMVGWYSQGEVVDRSQERLGESDKGVILFRRILKEQMKLVEEGKEPTIGIFRDVEENECIPTTLHQDVPARGQVTRASLSGNIGRDYDVIKELEEIFGREAAAVAAGVR
jgi:5,5'-dehydrodivanillate O-demethylase